MTKFFEYFKSISRFLALPVLSGIMVGTSFIPFNGWALLFGYIPLWLQIRRLLNEKQSLAKIFWSAWVTQFTLTMIGFNWIYYVTVEFGHLPLYVGICALILFSAFMHVYIAIALTGASWLIRKMRIQKDLIAFLCMGLCMNLMERIWPSIFEWNMAYTLLWIKIPIFQWADTVGFLGLSAWLFVAQAFLAQAFVLYKEHRKAALQTIAGVLGVLTALTFVGALKQKNWQKNNRSVKIGIAQGNVGNAEKLQSEKRSQFHSYIRGIYSDLTQKLQSENPAEVIIWPETAMPFVLEPSYLNRREQKALMTSIQQWNVPVITGGYSVSDTEKDLFGDAVYRNAVFYLSTQFDHLAPPYYKTNLLAFGEYMPLGQYFPFLYKLLPFVGTYAEGSGPVVANIQLAKQSVRLGPQICYDSLAPGFSRDLTKNGAQIIFNVTNDSWFGWWAEPFQHGYMNLARAIEVRRPLVRSTNTGISSVILADGTVLEESTMNQAWARTYDVPFRDNAPLSLYTRFGHYDWVIWAGLLVALLVIYRQKESENV